MTRSSHALRVGIVAVTTFVPILLLTAPGTPQEARKPLLVTLDPGATGYTQVLPGPPATAGIRSGYVVLAPGDSVGRHSTEQYEEVVVVLSGRGELSLTGGPTLELKAGVVAYNPPDTEHDVCNTGTSPLRYLYVVAPTETGH